MFFRGLEHEVCPSPWDRHPISIKRCFGIFFLADGERNLLIKWEELLMMSGELMVGKKRNVEKNDEYVMINGYGGYIYEKKKYFIISGSVAVKRLCQGWPGRGSMFG